MRLNLLFLFLVLTFRIFGQITTEMLAAGTNSNKTTPKSKLSISNNDSDFEKIIIESALYDAKRNNLPYFTDTKYSGISSLYQPKLKVNSVFIHQNATSGYIKKLIGNQLTSEFNNEVNFEYSGNQTITRFSIVPLRIRKDGLVEELIDYQIDWGSEQFNSNRLNSAATSSFTTQSVLTSGKWYKLAITKTGPHKINSSFLVKMGISPSAINPKNIRIYGNGGVQLPEKNSDMRYDDLTENAIYVSGESDNSFDANDFIIFYAQNTTKWIFANDSTKMFTHKNNIYSDTAYYYLNYDIGPGKRVNNIASLASPATTVTSTYDYYNFHEIDITNFVKSGRNFYGEYFDVTTSYNFSFNDGNFVIGDTLRLCGNFAGRGSVNNSYNLSANGIAKVITCPGIDLANYLSDYASLGAGFSKGLNSVSSAINVSAVKLTPNAVGWLDKFSVNARRELIYNGTPFNFRDKRVVAFGGKCEYQIQNVNNQLFVWNVTDFVNPMNQLYNLNGTTASLITSSDSLLEFSVFNPNTLNQEPSSYGLVTNQNLHSVTQADYIIVVPKQFLSYANRLAALHQQEEGLSYVVATTEQVYNEFGSGIADAAAIRDFARMVYGRGLSQNKPLKYMCLFGRGSYFNKNGRAGNNNFIPTYETENSVSYIYSVTSDDFFALMDPHEGFNAESYGAMDIGVGRLIISNTSEAENVVSKIENYYKHGVFPQTISNNCNTAVSNQLYGDWRNYILFSADDGDNALHMIQADKMANKVRAANPQFNINKVYVDAYKGLSTPGGKRYPDMQEAFNSRVQKGCLVMNYTGHGGEVGLSAERIVDIPIINSWKNFNGLPLFITATCEFARYDDPDRISAGEICLLNPDGGAVSLMTTCRLAFSNFNETLNNKLFDFMFKELPDKSKPALGDVVRLTKQSLGQNFFYSNFHLLGDPALKLAFPVNKIITTHINGNPVSSNNNDTIKGLSKVTIKGHVVDTAGSKITGLNGIVYPTIFDKSELITCQLNEPGSSTSPGTLTPFQFNSQQNIIYKGKAEVKNGEFEFSFLVPKDVSFNYGNAKFSYYATDGSIDATGLYDSVKVGGISSNIIPDAVGPEVLLYLNSKSFVNGGTTNETPILMAEISDSSGINTVGTGFGHDIVATIDGKTDKPIVLNDFYEAGLNSYQNGSIRYQISELEEGSHNLALKVWDVQNNSSVVNVDFIVAKSEDLALKMVLNYPNPFTTNTKFFFEHNRNCEDLKVNIQVFTISGKVAKTINQTVNCEGFRTEGIHWDGRDDYGDKLGKGVYLYKVSVVDPNNQKAEKIEKLVILN
ncbi:MAG: type IX secretion system sortase PorU [Bacteroidia bacterium]